MGICNYTVERFKLTDAEIEQSDSTEAQPTTAVSGMVPEYEAGQLMEITLASSRRLPIYIRMAEFEMELKGYGYTVIRAYVRQSAPAIL